jgi:hypothetical protein
MHWRRTAREDHSGVDGAGPTNAALQGMKYLKNLILISTLASMIGGCYVETRRPRYARSTCDYGWHWDGYRCHRNHRW